MVKGLVEGALRGPRIRLLLKANNLRDASVRETLLSEFEAEGISRDRIDLVVWTESREEHLKLYHRVDIGLDTFPFNGATTTCEAMWMGVPVTTFVGSRHAGRVGASILKQAGLHDLVADSVDEMISKTIALANDTGRLRSLRRSIRHQMRSLTCVRLNPRRGLSRPSIAGWLMSGSEPEGPGKGTSRDSSRPRFLLALNLPDLTEVCGLGCIDGPSRSFAGLLPP